MLSAHRRIPYGPLTVAMLLALASPVRAGETDKGRGLYTSRCMFCHGANGKGDGPAGGALKPPPTDFTSADYWKTANIDTMKAAILNGKPGTAMVAFKSAMSPEQLDDLVAYLETFKPAP